MRMDCKFDYFFLSFDSTDRCGADFSRRFLGHKCDGADADNDLMVILDGRDCDRLFVDGLLRREEFYDVHRVDPVEKKTVYSTEKKIQVLHFFFVLNFHFVE